MSNKKVYTVEVSQNGWEYTGTCHITASSIANISMPDEDFHAVEADGLVIMFDEQIILKPGYKELNGK